MKKWFFRSFNKRIEKQWGYCFLVISGIIKENLDIFSASLKTYISRYQLNLFEEKQRVNVILSKAITNK